MTAQEFTRESIDHRIIFHDADEIMEVNFEGLTFKASVDVNRFYDRIEERVIDTGQEFWFFLVNYCKTRIEPDAWFAFSRRGKALNLAHSMGTARFDATEVTLRQIKNAGTRENFDPNLFYDRASALGHLGSIPSQRVELAKVKKSPTIKARDLYWRIEFIPEEETVYVDFSNMSFEHSADVDLVFDFIEDQVQPLDRKWYFLINYNGTLIQSPAWVKYSARGKGLNKNWSLGTVRFAAGSETEADIRLRAESQDFQPDIRNTIEQARKRIEELRKEDLRS